MPSTYDKRGKDLGYYSDTVQVTTIANITSTVQQILAPNPDRKGFSIYNVATGSLYVRLEASTNGDTRRIAGDSSYDMEFPFVYRGAVFARRNGTATGQIIVTEYT